MSARFFLGTHQPGRLRPDPAPHVRLSTGETAPVGLWLAASVLLGRDVLGGQPYPCVCSSSQGCERNRNREHCWRWGRNDDLAHLPATCCAVRAAARPAPRASADSRKT
jgi:hypothetical protein